ncbi:MAG: alkaline phosphatase D family protein [Parvularculaceae bacterium]
MTQRVTRRAALQAALASGATACAPRPELRPYTASAEKAGGVFKHGIASGDPGPDSVVVWTRVSVAEDARTMRVIWEIAADPDFSDMRGKGEAEARASSDWTVKVVLRDLQPGATYYYRFRIGDAYSPVGRTKTLPAGAVERARFAVVSCSNHAFGYFNVYDLIARRDDLDAVIHLGDYIYEHGPDGYGGETGARLGRAHDPAHELLTLDDYRRRHAQYKADPSTQAVHAAHPFIPVWDDHEISNNSWKSGADNHDPLTEGDWEGRRRAGLQAYYEWMPVREPEPGKAREALFRSYSFGDLLTLAAIETRLMARARQFEYSEVVPTLKTPEDVERFKKEILWDDTREMLGAGQLDFLDRTLRSSIAEGQPWRLVANQILMAEVIAPDLRPYMSEEDIVALEKLWDQARSFVESSALGLPTNFDAWDGYPAARERFYHMVREAGAKGLIVLTGDTHTWWANDLYTRTGDHMGVELGVHSVTSPSEYDKDFLGGKGADYALLTNKKNKAVRYLSGDDHGYIDLEVTRKAAKARFIAVDTIEDRAYNAFTKAAFDIRETSNGVKFARGGNLTFKEWVLFR